MFSQVSTSRRKAAPVKGATKGTVGVGGYGGGGAGGGSADLADEGEDAFILYQLPCVGGGKFGLVGVVQRHQRQLPPVDAASPVCFGKSRLNAQAHIYAQLPGRAAERRGLAEENAFGGDARRFRCSRRLGEAVTFAGMGVGAGEEAGSWEPQETKPISARTKAMAATRRCWRNSVMAQAKPFIQSLHTATVFSLPCRSSRTRDRRTTFSM